MLEQEKMIIIPSNLISLSDEFCHFGTPRHSGRYKWGSGERPYQGDDISVSKKNRLKHEKAMLKADLGVLGAAAVGTALYVVGHKTIRKISTEATYIQMKIERKMFLKGL